MKTKIIKIGNSKGIRIPNPILKQCHIENEVEMLIEGDKIIITPIEKISRKGWDEKFKEMNNNGDDKLLIDDNISIDFEEWEW